MFSNRSNSLTPSSTVELNAKVAELKARGVDIIKFNIGEPDFGTPDNVKLAAKKALDAEFTKYTPVSGILELRKAICEKLARDNGIQREPAEVCVSTGAKQALFNALMTIAQEGDEIIIPVPCWVSYEEMVRVTGAEPVFVQPREKGNFSLDLEAVEKAVTPRTRGIIINTPNNPTGTVYTEAELRQLAEIAVRRDIFVIVDEVYEKLIYDGNTHFSMGSIPGDARRLCITVNGFSKTYAMTGWRVGYTAADRAVIARMNALQGHMTSGPCSIAQKAALEAITGPQDSVEAMRRAFSKRREVLLHRLRETPDLTCSNAGGAFYLLPDVSRYFGKSADGQTIGSATDFAAFLLEKAHIAVVPGEGFRAPGHVRMSYSDSLERLEEGMDRMQRALALLR